MANLMDKEVIFGHRDMPAKMSASLPQETMQAMTSGEGMEIPRKWASNVILKLDDYSRIQGSTKRENVCKTCKQMFRSGCCPSLFR